MNARCAGRQGRGVAGGAALLAGLVAVLTAAAPFPASEHGPEPGHTGGFGEPTCRACHFDGPERPEDAAVSIEGLPAKWTPASEYPIDIVVSGTDVRRGGFQLAVRHAAGGLVGTQAGRLAGPSGGLSVTDRDGIAYIHHNVNGTTPDAAGELRWRIVWIAPTEPTGPVAFHVAANAANDDRSEFGDRIVTAADTVSPSAR